MNTQNIQFKTSNDRCMNRQISYLDIEFGQDISQKLEHTTFSVRLLTNDENMLALNTVEFSNMLGKISGNRQIGDSF